MYRKEKFSAASSFKQRPAGQMLVNISEDQSKFPASGPTYPTGYQRLSDYSFFEKILSIVHRQFFEGDDTSVVLVKDQIIPIFLASLNTLYNCEHFYKLDLPRFFR